MAFFFGFLLALSALWGKTIRLRSVIAGSTLHVGLTVNVVIMRIGVIMVIQLVWIILFLLAPFFPAPLTIANTSRRRPLFVDPILLRRSRSNSMSVIK